MNSLTNRLCIRYEPEEMEELFQRLGFHGEITYHSPVMNLVFVRIKKSIEEVRKMQGVISVENEHVGRLTTRATKVNANARS